MGDQDDNRNTAGPDKSFRPGSLRSIKLTNFMCHESFEQQFGPRVSFIIGPNGSGKSALLTALMCALGGRATTTSRAKRTSEFVMIGKKYAKIIVVLQNYEKVMDQKHAFRPDDYGKTIIIEKEIHRDTLNGKEESSRIKLTLRNHHNKKVSERKAELDEMLEHFGILINNPICILNQEVSKTFLHSKKAEDQYDLFMKATTLENIEIEYDQCKESHSNWNECNNRGKVGFKILDQEYANCKEKTKAIQNRGKNHLRLGDLRVELYWAFVKNDEDNCDKLKEKIESFRADIASSRVEIEKQETRVKKYEEEEHQLMDRTDNFNGLIQKTKEKADDISKKITDASGVRIIKNHDVERSVKYLNRLKKEKKHYEESIEETKRILREQNALDQDEEKRKSDIEILERDIAHLQSRLKSLDIETVQVGASVGQRLKDQYAAQGITSDLDSRLKLAKLDLSRLTNGQQNSLRKYGDHFVKLVEAISKYHQAHSNDNQGFAFKPIGPLGYHIKLINPDIANALELHLGKNASAFLCHNTRDMKILNSIFDKTLYGLPRPSIIIRPFTKRHNVDVHKTAHQEFKTILEYLDIENDAVFNVCVDRSNLENVLYIPDYRIAQNLLMTASLVPAKIRCAYTSDCYVMYPINSPGGYRSYANDTSRLNLFSKSDTHAINEMKKHIQKLEADYRVASERYQHLVEQTSSQRKTHDSCINQQYQLVAECRKKEAELENLKLVVPTAKPTELEGLEQDLEKCLDTITNEEIELLRKREELAVVERELADLNSQRVECKKILEGREDERIKIARDLQKAKDVIDDANLLIKGKKDIITKREKNLAEIEAELSEAHESLDRKIANAPNKAARPTDLRSIEDVQDDIKRLEARIRAIEEEQMDPNEVLENLRKRMGEIENLTELKDSNFSNFKLMSNSIEEREIGFTNLKHNVVGAVSATFASVMQSMKMRGELMIYMDALIEGGETVKKAKTLEINIETNYLPNSQRVNSTFDGDPIEPTHQSQPAISASRAKRARLDQSVVNTSGKENTIPDKINMTNTKSLSGGERSFSTVALVLSLWHHCASPFKLMDEIDVFMDMVTRRVSYNALIRFAQCSAKPGQFIFFSPLELPKFDDPHSLVKVFEMPAIQRKDQSSVPT